MNLSDIKPVSQLALRYPPKAIIYGGPGTGKTPLCTTAPNPIIAFAEPGLLSVRTYNGPGVVTDTYAKMLDFWKWAASSREAVQFETKCADSVSQMAEIVLNEELPKNKDPRKAYGTLSEKIMTIMNLIYFTPTLQALLICKETTLEVDGQKKFRPYFPGNDLNIKIGHLYDLVLRIELVRQPNGSEIKAIRTRENFAAFARDRSGNLDELEPANISHIFNKVRR